MVTFCPALINLPKILQTVSFLLELELETKNVFSDGPFVSFRNARNLKSYLVRAKMYPVGERIVGSRKCKSLNCKTCCNIRENNQFTSISYRKTFKINHKLYCNSKKIVYLLICKVCEKQYVGQTKNPFRFRWNNYKSVHTKAVKGENVSKMSFHQ